VKIPAPLFVVINSIMRFLLKSPLHRMFSDSLMLITFTGRKSGRQFTTPVRYVQTDDGIRCFTAKENQWWRNLRNGAEVTLRIKGTDGRYLAEATTDSPEEIEKWLLYYLTLYPQDAAYHDIRLNKDKSLNPDDLNKAVHDAVAVLAKPLNPA